MSARGAMTMRATTERDKNLYPTDANRDPYGNKVAKDWDDYLTALPCYLWYSSGGRTKHEDKLSMNIDTARMICPLNADILDGDRIKEVCDRRGNKLFGAFSIEGPIHRRRGHLEIVLKEVS